jgi:hypothetical protein
MSEKATEQLQLRMPQSLWDALARLAAAEDRSLSEYCRTQLSLHAFGAVQRLEQSTVRCEGCNALSQTAQKL